MTDTKFEIILETLFLKFSNVDVSFGEGSFIWRIYIINKTLFTIKQVQIIDKKNFIIVALDANSKTFVVYMVI